MTDQEIDLLIKLIDAKIELAMAESAVGADGYTSSAPDERQAVRDAEQQLRDYFRRPHPR